jgi:hypothetical protein
VYVVSAAHSLVDLDQELAPYDQSLDELPVREGYLWAGRVVTRLMDRHRGPIALTLLVGEKYARHLRGDITFRRSEHYTGRKWTGPPVEEPLLHMPIGRRISWLRQALVGEGVDVEQLLHEPPPEATPGPRAQAFATAALALVGGGQWSPQSSFAAAAAALAGPPRAAFATAAAAFARAA